MLSDAHNVQISYVVPRRMSTSLWEGCSRDTQRMRCAPVADDAQSSAPVQLTQSWRLVIRRDHLHLILVTLLVYFAHQSGLVGPAQHPDSAPIYRLFSFVNFCCRSTSIEVGQTVEICQDSMQLLCHPSSS